MVCVQDGPEEEAKEEGGSQGGNLGSCSAALHDVLRLSSPSCIWVLPDEYTICISLGDDSRARFRIQYLPGSTVHTVHASVFGGFLVLTLFLRDCGPRILRLIRCLRRLRSTGLRFLVMTSGKCRRKFVLSTVDTSACVSPRGFFRMSHFFHMKLDPWTWQSLRVCLA